ncbi:MAG: rhomboid family intramembrane serine protease, partial [Microbacterium sp.]
MTSAEFASNRDNFCYRHPDRQSFVLCQRCLRTVCPECQTQAAVGVICPECLSAQQTPPPAARGWAGVRLRSSTTSIARDARPLATYWIIGITSVVSVAGLLLPGQLLQQLLIFYPPLLYPDLSGSFEPWRLLTLVLLHGSFWHLAFNMLALWMIARSLEPLLGRARFLVLYGLSALGGSVAVVLLAFGTPVLGASGAIFGLFGALLVIGRHLGANMTGIAIVLAVNLAIGFVPGFNVAWQAHVGGLLVGAAVGFVFARTRTRRQ